MRVTVIRRPLSAALTLGTTLLIAGCASGRGRAPVVDLQPARAALEEARQAGAPERAAQSFGAAAAQLKKAEDLVQRRLRGAAQEAVRAEWMARLASAQAQCVKTQEGTRQQLEARTVQEGQQAQARLRRLEDENRRLEDRLAAQQRDLEVTEMELIRTKARLKGIETKAEASSAIAEARILLRRVEGKGALYTSGTQSLSKAEQQLREENYGAAIFFALKAQDLANRAHEDGDSRRPPATLPQHVVVKVNRANIRKGAEVKQPVLATAPRGTVLAVQRAQGEWLLVTYGSITGWVSRSVVE